MLLVKHKSVSISILMLSQSMSSLRTSFALFLMALLNKRFRMAYESWELTLGSWKHKNFGKT